MGGCGGESEQLEITIFRMDQSIIKRTYTLLGGRNVGLGCGHVAGELATGCFEIVGKEALELYT